MTAATTPSTTPSTKTPQLAPLPRLILHGDTEGRYRDDLAVAAAIIAMAARQGIGLDVVTKAMRDPNAVGGRWLRDGGERDLLAEFYRTNRVEARATQDIVVHLLWIAARTPWPGKTGETQYRTLCALLETAATAGTFTFHADQRRLALIAGVKREKLVLALTALETQGLVTVHRDGDGMHRYELGVDRRATHVGRDLRAKLAARRDPDTWSAGENRVLGYYTDTPAFVFPTEGLLEMYPTLEGGFSPRDERGPLSPLYISLGLDPLPDEVRGDTGPLSSAPVLPLSKVTDISKSLPWRALHPAFGHGRLDQRVWLSLPVSGTGATVEHVAMVTGRSTKTAKTELDRLVKAGMVHATSTGYLHTGGVADLDRIASENGGLAQLEGRLAKYRKERDAWVRYGSGERRDWVAELNQLDVGGSPGLL